MSTNVHFIIDRIVEENESTCCAYFQEQLYDKINNIREWKDINRMLVDSELKQLIYVLEIENEWQNIRFPISVWQEINSLLTSGQQLYLAVSIDHTGNSLSRIALSQFSEECNELLNNMVQNVNFGEELSQLAEAYFESAIQLFKEGE